MIGRYRGIRSDSAKAMPKWPASNDKTTLQTFPVFVDDIIAVPISQMNILSSIAMEYLWLHGVKQVTIEAAHCSEIADRWFLGQPCNNSSRKLVYRS